MEFSAGKQMVVVKYTYDMNNLLQNDSEEQQMLECRFAIFQSTFILQ